MSKAFVADLLDQAQWQSTQPIQLGLQRVVRLLADLGNPQQTLDVVHVAGTNGKGSVLAFLETILRHAGYHVGLYISPHLHNVNERIRVDGRSISDETLGKLLQEVLAVNAGRPATFFELITVVALCCFNSYGLGRHGQRQGIVLLETGLGGRLDATNVVCPRLAIITAIGMDHMDYLGTTLTTIAEEKAGIFKKDVPAVAAPGHAEAERSLLRQAVKVGTPLGLLGRDFTFSHTPVDAPVDAYADESSLEVPTKTWFFHKDGEMYELPLPGLLGRHQFDNAALAVAGILRLRQAGWQIAADAIVTGIRDTRWPGRLERFSVQMSRSTPSVAILLDGAHNQDACLALARFLGEATEGSNVLIFSALQDKNVEAMVTILAPHVQRVWTTQVGQERGISAEVLAAMWLSLDRPAQPCATPAEALAAACSACPVSGQVVVCGSLYLVGAIRAILL